jgi:hypothetical protein
VTCSHGGVHPALVRLVIALWVTVAASVGLGAVASTAAAEGPAVCPFISTADAAKAATAVFTGIPTSATRLEKPSDELGAYFLHEVTVTRVYRGEVDAETVEVRTEQTPRECSLGKLEIGTEYVLFVANSGDLWVARSGGGTRAADAETVDKVVRLLGQGSAPVPPKPEPAVFTPVATDPPATLSEAVAPGLALAGAGLLGLLVVRALSRRRRNP